MKKYLWILLLLSTNALRPMDDINTTNVDHVGGDRTATSGAGGGDTGTDTDEYITEHNDAHNVTFNDNGGGSVGTTTDGGNVSTPVDSVVSAHKGQGGTGSTSVNEKGVETAKTAIEVANISALRGVDEIWRKHDQSGINDVTKSFNKIIVGPYEETYTLNKPPEVGDLRDDLEWDRRADGEQMGPLNYDQDDVDQWHKYHTPEKLQEMLAARKQDWINGRSFEELSEQYVNQPVRYEDISRTLKEQADQRAKDLADQRAKDLADQRAKDLREKEAKIARRLTVKQINSFKDSTLDQLDRKVAKTSKGQGKRDKEATFQAWKTGEMRDNVKGNLNRRIDLLTDHEVDSPDEDERGFLPEKLREENLGRESLKRIVGNKVDAMSHDDLVQEYWKHNSKQGQKINVDHDQWINNVPTTEMVGHDYQEGASLSYEKENRRILDIEKDKKDINDQRNTKLDTAFDRHKRSAPRTVDSMLRRQYKQLPQ